MLEPIQQKSWPRADRRAWSLSLSLFVLVLGFGIAAWLLGRGWTYQTDLEYIPKELSIKAYDIGSDLMEFSLGLPNYAFGEYFVITEILPESWIYLPAIAVFILAFSLLAAAITYFEDSWLYPCLAGISVGVALFSVESFLPFGFQGQWLSALSVLLVAGPVYAIQAWFSNWNLARRWWVLLVWFSTLILALVFKDFSVREDSLVVAQLWFPLLIGSILFVVMNSTDVLQGMVTMLTREENNTQSWLHFTVFSFLYLSNYVLIYLKNTGILVLDIFYFNPFALQFFTLLFGFWMLDKKSELTQDENQRSTGLSALYVSLGVIFCLTAGLSFGLANDLMVEVLEDTISLVHFCMGVSFYLYVLINYFQLMGLGLKVHLVLFKPRYMPVFAIPVFGLGGVVVFLLNEGYFPYYQALSAKQVLLADHARHSGETFLAENYLKSALSLESRSQRTNLSMAGLYYELGNPALAQRYAEASLDKQASPEAFLAMAQIYRQKNLPLYELLQLQEGIRKFPEEGRLLNNIGISFNETVYKDSSLFYFSKAAKSREAGQAGNSNLGFYYLAHKLEKEGLPKKSPESDQYVDWAQLNNHLVFANVAGETASGLADVSRKFPLIPESLQPYILFHSYINKAITRDSSGQAALTALENDSLKKFYGEAIALGKGMMKYRCGKTREGIEDLLRLYNQSSANRLDLTLLMGQIYYDQGSFASAASFFRKAAGMGMNKSRYWYALSCLDAGKKSEAAEAFRESLPYLSQADKVRISVLIDGLSSGKFHNAAQRSDPEKSAFLKINWERMQDKEVHDLIYLISDKEAQRFLWKYAFDRAYKENRAGRCRDLFSFGQKLFSRNPKWQVFLKESRPLMLEITGQTKSLASLKERGQLEGRNFILGRLFQMQKETGNAAEFFLKAIEDNPLNTRQMIHSIEFLFQQPGMKDLAYQKALEISDLDPSNVEYLKLYALLSVRIGVPDFAYQVLPRLEVLSSKPVADVFRAVLKKELEAKNYPDFSSAIP